MIAIAYFYAAYVLNNGCMILANTEKRKRYRVQQQLPRKMICQRFYYSLRLVFRCIEMYSSIVAMTIGK